MSTKMTGRIVGALFLLAFVVYGVVGGALVESGAGSPAVLTEVIDHQAQIAVGALLMLLNSAFVIAIGVLVFPILRPHHEISAYVYLITRVVEAVILAVGVLCLLLLLPIAQTYADLGANSTSVLPSLAHLGQEANHYAMLLAMIGLGLGSLMFCRVLFRARLIPRPMAVWGMAGYAVLATGAVLEVLGYEVFMALTIPGGLFEIALGVLLALKGFPARENEIPAGADATAAAGPSREALDVR